MIGAAAERIAVRWLGFGSLRTRLAVLYASLFALALLIVAIAAQIMILSHARASVRAELSTSATVFERLWALRAQSLGDSADVLARDFGFRAAVASGDRPTIASALANLRRRAGVDEAIVLDENGAVIGDDGGTLGSKLADIPFKSGSARHDAVIARGGRVYRLVASPVFAPVEIGWVVFAIRLDEAQIRTLDGLSAIPLSATVLRREGASWRPVTGSHAPDSPALRALIDRAMRGTQPEPGIVALERGAALALAKPLAAASGPPEAALLLSYPLAEALRPYRTLQTGLVAAGILGLALVLWGTRRLATSIARPIAALDAAARSLEDGGRVELAIESQDEIGRLAKSFNRMSAGIVEREHRIAHLAFHDTLTGLANRTALRQQLDVALTRARNRGGEVGLLSLDLDGFSAINDTLGHPIGDAVLRAVARMLVDRAVDGTVARLGADEFAILLADAERDRPRALAQAILDALRRPLAAEGHEVTISASIGIALGPRDGLDADALLNSAMLALARAKQAGRGRCHFFEVALDAAARRRHQMEMDLREAIRTGQFHLDFQPIYDLGQERVTCFEALLRWNHPIDGPISPADFIPVAEEAGLIVEIGEWVLYEATRTASAWPEDVRVAVNVSPLQMGSAGLPAVIINALSRSGLAPQRLEVELTESVFLAGAADTIVLLHSLRGLGLRIALDDFGTGYSSLSYLRSFPFDKIKIDRSFVVGVGRDRSSAAIIRAIVDLAAAFDMETTAEGVEDASQLAALRRQGCRSIQGFYFSRPVRAADVPAQIARAGAIVEPRQRKRA